MSSTEFLPFEDHDPDRPGVVVLGNDEDAFWTVVTDAAWEHEWWYGDPAAERFDGQYRTAVEEEWSAWVREHVEAPEWRWWVWLDDPDEDGWQTLEPADEGELGAFRAALVILR